MFRLSPTSVSVEEYLRLEQEATERHELVGGQIYAMAGASREHSAIATNISGHFWLAAQGKPCRVHRESMKLRIGDTIYYPDVMVTCTESPNRYYEDDPCALVEVLSALLHK